MFPLFCFFFLFFSFFVLPLGFLCLKRNQLISPISSLTRPFSHVIRILMFENLKWRRKADWNFRRKFLENHFRHIIVIFKSQKLYSGYIQSYIQIPKAIYPKLYSIHQSWLARSYYHVDTLWKIDGWSTLFLRSYYFRCCHEGVCHKRINKKNGSRNF